MKFANTLKDKELIMRIIEKLLQKIVDRQNKDVKYYSAKEIKEMELQGKLPRCEKRDTLASKWLDKIKKHNNSIRLG